MIGTLGGGRYVLNVLGKIGITLRRDVRGNSMLAAKNNMRDE